MNFAFIDTLHAEKAKFPERLLRIKHEVEILNNKMASFKIYDFLMSKASP